MDQPEGRACEFGPFRYDPAQRLLFREGAIVPLVPKAIDTLQVLLERRGRMVEKAELMKLVWPDAVVEEVGLARNISVLRKALGDEGDPSAYIETIPRRGYRFTAEVREVSPAPEPQRRRVWMWAATGAAAVALAALVYWQFYTPSRYLPSGKHYAGLAVVPFDCPNADLAEATVPQTLSELLVVELSKLDGAQVVAPSTVRRHQRFGISMGLMGRLLGLDVLVEGTVQRAGDQIRVTSRLVDVHTGKIVWSDSMEYPGADLDWVVTSAAREITAKIAARISVPRPPH
jgi:DNA-binding winged helix-turn-helix (wHTH) protein/TolB-like protein